MKLDKNIPAYKNFCKF